MTGYLPRELSRLAGEALKALPVVVVTGLRQVGKTTFLESDPVFSGYRYATLDDFPTLEAARREPESLLRGADPLIVDEVQRCPELLVDVKREVDRRRAPGRFVLSGSANLSLLGGVAESLAGRALYFTMRPLTRRERLRRTDSPPLLVRLLQDENPDRVLGRRRRDRAADRVGGDEVLDGGMPPITLGQTGNRRLWLLGYEQTYLERDVRNLSQVADLVSLRNLARLTALRTAQVLKLSELARDAKLPASTATRYVGLLEASFLVERLQPWLRSRTTRLIKSPKVHVTDSGIAAYLMSVDRLESGASGRGQLYETWVHQNLAAILAAHAPEAELHYWSVQGRYEVDFVVASGERCVGIEVNAATRFGDSDLRPLRSFLERTPGAVAGILAYNGAEAVALGDGLYAVPLSLLVS